MRKTMDNDELHVFQYKLIEYRNHLQAKLDAFSKTEYGDRSEIERQLKEHMKEVKRLRGIIRKIRENNKANMDKILRIARQIKAINQLINNSGV